MSILNINEQDKMQIDFVAEQTETNSVEYTGISDKLVVAYSSDLDALMNAIKVDCVDNEPSDKMLESYTMQLSNALYSLYLAGILVRINNYSNLIYILIYLQYKYN